MATSETSLLLFNAHVITMDRFRPRAEAVAVSGERITQAGSNAEIACLASGRTWVIDCQGLTLLPGFNDAHCHLSGLARRLQDLDCSPPHAPSMAVLQARVKQWVESRPSSRWVRGFGYDDLRMAERRHPDRHDLDAAAPNNPVWLEHRSGHTAALNTRALRMAGIGMETSDPPGGVIDRDPSTGEPTGTLFEMRAFLRERLGNTRDPQEFESGVRAADKLLLSYGITSVQDAGADNGIARWRTFHSLQSNGILSGRITMFAGIERLAELADSGLVFGSACNRLRVGHAKIMATLTAGRLHPSFAELKSMVDGAHQRGFPVAIHCIEEESITAAAEVLLACRLYGLVDRIEHCAEGTPHLVDAVKRSGAMVVTQPGLIYHNGPSYRQNVDARLLADLYPAGALLRSSVPTAFSSDAPVIEPNPWPAICSAVTRCTSDGLPLEPMNSNWQKVGVEDALRMYTIAGAKAEGMPAEKGSIAPAKLADMVLVDTDPLAISPASLPNITAVMTIIGGSIVWGEI